ncbi:MAG: hypothetical protein P1U57_11945 [Oleibacter sp.]|nr:hypothetical protein [Thalassolituus sp.]
MLSRGGLDSPHYLVYEVARDFLSTPRKFVLLNILSEGPLYWPEPADTEFGIHLLSDEDGDFWQVHLPTLSLEVVGQIHLLKEGYGYATARAAMMDLLSASASA